MGIWCQNDVVLTSMRRDDVASTSIRRHFGTKCLLGNFRTAEATAVVNTCTDIFNEKSHHVRRYDSQCKQTHKFVIST